MVISPTANHDRPTDRPNYRHRLGTLAPIILIEASPTVVIAAIIGLSGQALHKKFHLEFTGLPRDLVGISIQFVSFNPKPGFCRDIPQRGLTISQTSRKARHNAWFK